MKLISPIYYPKISASALGLKSDLLALGNLNARRVPSGSCFTSQVALGRKSRSFIWSIYINFIGLTPIMLLCQIIVSCRPRLSLSVRALICARPIFTCTDERSLYTIYIGPLYLWYKSNPEQRSRCHCDKRSIHFHRLVRIRKLGQVLRGLRQSTKAVPLALSQLLPSRANGNLAPVQCNYRYQWLNGSSGVPFLKLN